MVVIAYHECKYACEINILIVLSLAQERERETECQREIDDA